MLIRKNVSQSIRKTLTENDFDIISEKNILGNHLYTTRCTEETAGLREDFLRQGAVK